MDTPLTPRVLQLVPSLAEGGTEQGTVDMAFYIKSHGGGSWLASAGGRWVEILAAQGIDHTTLPLDRKAPWWIVWNSWQIARLIRQNDIQIVHARSRAPAWSAWLALKFLNLTCAKYITTFHGTYGASGWWKKAYNGVMLKGPLVIANSQFIKRHIMDTYGLPAGRIMVAERGVDTMVFDPAKISAATRAKLLKDLKVPTGTPLLLLTGRLTRWKGHGVLLRALAQLKQLPWVVAFAGNAKHPAYLDELKQLASALGIAQRVRWLGPRKDIPALNATATLAFSCSTEPEAFGRVAIEAMAMGTPVIASAHGGSLETVVDGTTGWLVPTGDVERLAIAIEEALTDPARLKRMGKAGRTRVLAHFTSEHTCAAEWAAYKKLLRL